MRPRLTRFFTIVGVVTTALMGIVLVLWAVTCAMQEDVPDEVVLELSLDRPVVDSATPNPLAMVLGGSPTQVRDVVAALERARTDDRVVGLVVWVGDVQWGMGIVQEVRDAIVQFRSAGKFAIAYADTFGELAPGNQAYWLASACDEVWLQPTGSLGLMGLLSEAYFVRGTLDLVGVVADGDHRKAYKNALNMFTERRYTPAHREAAQTLVDDMFGVIVRDVAQARRMDEDALRTLVDRGPFLAQDALDHGLVDRLAYRDEVIAEIESRTGKDVPRLFADAYLERAGSPWLRGKRIALVNAIGAVTRGDSSVDPLLGDEVMGSRSVTAALRAAVEDDEVRAIVLRVDSPGGSAVASDSIWREVGRAREAGKPVIVSMGNVAASGGYYISASATKIVAHPGTVTGSIGVLGGKPVTREAWNKVGVTWDWVKSSQHADLFSNLERFDGEGHTLLDAWLDRVYEDFTSRVADGRGLSREQVEAAAQGRVWSGVRAHELGLVDALGGLPTAIALARQEAGIGQDEPIELRTYPEPKGLVQQFFGGQPDSSDEVRTQAAAGAERWRSVAARAATLGLLDDEAAVLMMSPLDVGP